MTNKNQQTQMWIFGRMGLWKEGRVEKEREGKRKDGRKEERWNNRMKDKIERQTDTERQTDRQKESTARTAPPRNRQMNVSAPTISV